MGNPYNSQESFDGWQLLPGCVLPEHSSCFLRAVALHAQHGIALLDAYPNETPEAGQRLVDRLRRAGFVMVYGEVWPPIRHLILYEEEFTQLKPILERAFRDYPAPEVPGGDAWVDTVARALLREPPRSVAPQPTPEPPPEPAEPPPETAAPRRWPQPVLAVSLLPILLGVWAAWPISTSQPSPQAPMVAESLSILDLPIADAPPPPPMLLPPVLVGYVPVADPPAQPVLASPSAAAPSPPPATRTRSNTSPAASRAATKPSPVRPERNCRSLVHKVHAGKQATEEHRRQLRACQRHG
jgi:hypothetical protein